MKVRIEKTCGPLDVEPYLIVTEYLGSRYRLPYMSELQDRIKESKSLIPTILSDSDDGNTTALSCDWTPVIKKLFTGSLPFAEYIDVFTSDDNKIVDASHFS